MRHTDIVIYESYSVEAANDALIKQVVLFLDPNWFGWMTPFMCAKYMRIRDINDYRKMWAFEQAYEAEAGELGPEGMYSVVLMPVLKVTSNGSIVSDWEPADEKCSRCHGGRRCLLPVDSDNGHPACAECLISSHGCPNHVACAIPVKKKATHSDKGKGKAGPAPVKCSQVFVLVPRLKPSSQPPATGEPAQPEAGPSNMPTALNFMVEFQSFCSRPMQERPPTGHNPVTDFTFNLAEHCLSGMTHPREAAWDQILALTHQLITAHRALEYELRQSGPFSAEEVEYLLQTRYPDSMLPPDDEHNEESAEGKGNA
ncbi:hypothetical protein ARMGADRAFT_1071402 [Armillaria gallica]|uniref:Uncharacterized protein n=1 Tax=Armillaria gallica TaxID=47427 RepID=A0A2H3E6X0_ARMGA|nr:hypothetical protein ARMGADRAFT_1071402 [Armillaria gallica]